MNMKGTKILVIAALFVMTTNFTEAKETTAPLSARTITVQGSSQIDVTPDQAEVNISVVNAAQTANEAQKDNANAAANVQQSLISSGIAEASIRTAQYNVYPIYSNETDKNNKSPIITSYRVTNTITVTLSNVSAVGTVIDTALSAGANQISNVRFSKKNELQVKQLVLQSAVKEATAKAEAIASTLNKQITGVIAANESGVSVQIPEFQSKMLRSDAVSANTPITPGTIKVDGSVTIVFEIE